jgi:hypothetical protein
MLSSARGILWTEMVLVLRKSIHLVFFLHGRPLWRMRRHKIPFAYKVLYATQLIFQPTYSTTKLEITYENRLNTFQQALGQFTAFFPLN